ncbi:MarR family transcriptional regulator [Pandoraea anapnoica]|uniref:MarR family transcriptional regulator n=2 Tax=Pandoraea anapnoica TaxID=2508301 RepID=A0A5E5AGF6_9BURK|nr:MarR family transcriptional regulator [Pandoraea anapnoica]
MQATLAQTRYSASAVHAIMEIGARRCVTSAYLGEYLKLNKSSVSRMVRKLLIAGEPKETPGRDDARKKLLSLTPRGRRTLAAIHAFGRRQVSGALDHMSEAERDAVVRRLAIYARALQAVGQREPDHLTT